MANDEVLIEQEVSSCHIKESELREFVCAIKERFESPPEEEWTHKLRKVHNMDNPYTSNSQKKGKDNRTCKIAFTRQVTAGTWAEFSTKIRSEQKGRRVQGVRLRLSTDEINLFVSFGDEEHKFHNRPRHRVNITCVGQEAPSALLVVTALHHLNRAANRAAKWTALKFSILVTASIVPTLAIIAHFVSKATKKEAPALELAGELAGNLFILLIAGAIPYLIIASMASDRTAACVILDRQPKTKRPPASYTRFVDYLHDHWISRPFLADASRSSALLTLFSLLVAILSFLASIVALLK